MVCCTMAAFAFHDRERISPICCGTGEEFESNVRASGKHGDSEPTSGNNGKFRKWEYGILWSWTYRNILSTDGGMWKPVGTCGRRSSANIVNKERSARTDGILQYLHPIRAVALKRLNCRAQNRTHGSLRGRGLPPPIRLFILRYCPVRVRCFEGGLHVQRILWYSNGFSSCKGSGTWTKYRVSTCPYASDRL